MAAGAGSVSHMASMAAIFIFWFSPARYPLSSPSTTTESAEARPKLAATVMERLAKPGLRPLSRNQALIAMTKIEPVT